MPIVGPGAAVLDHSTTVHLNSVAPERTPITQIDQIWMDGRPYRVAPQFHEDLVNIMSRKVNQGDPGPDDHPTFTTWISRDWSGGVLYKNINAASDNAKSWWSTANLEYPQAMGLPTRRSRYEIGESGTCFILGQLAGYLIVSRGANYYRVDPNTMAGTLVLVSDVAPIGTGTVYTETTGSNRTIMYIPCGSKYVILSTTPGWGGATQPTGAVDFAIYDDKIFRLDLNGRMAYKTDETQAWVNDAIIPDGSTPRRLVPYLTNSNSPSLYVITDRSAFSHDFSNHILHYTDLEYPTHPYQGLAAVKHRTDLFVSAGVGVHEYNGDIIRAMGLDSADGMPEEYRGYIVDMVSSYNGLFAVVRGVPVNIQGAETATLDLGPGHDPINFPETTSENVLMYHNGLGWLVKSVWSGGAPTSLFVSQEPHAVWWGTDDGYLYKIPLSTMYYNSRYSEAPFDLESVAFHETGWYDWGWLGSDKIAKQIEVKVAKITEGMAIEVQYKLDDDENDWVSLETIDHTTVPNGRGEIRFLLGLDSQEPIIQNNVLNSFHNYKGVRHERIKLRFTLRNDTDNLRMTPVIEWFTVVCRRWLRPQRTWRFEINATETYGGWTKEQQEEHIFGLSVGQQAFVLQVGEFACMAELVSRRKTQRSGKNQGLYLAVDLMEANDLGPDGQV